MKVDIANLLRFLAVAEIFFSASFVCYRWWKRPKRYDYLGLMGLALVAYSLYAAGTMITRYNLPLSWWRTPSVFVAASLTLVAVIREGWHSKEWHEKKRRDEIDN